MKLFMFKIIAAVLLLISPPAFSTTYPPCSSLLSEMDHTWRVPSVEDLVSAYRFIFQSFGFDELSAHELKSLLQAGQENPDGFFKIPDNGSVKRGQLLVALNYLKQWISDENKKEIQKLLAQEVKMFISRQSLASMKFEQALVERKKISNPVEAVPRDFRISFLRRVFTTQDSFVFYTYSFSRGLSFIIKKAKLILNTPAEVVGGNVVSILETGEKIVFNENEVYKGDQKILTLPESEGLVKASGKTAVAASEDGKLVVAIDQHGHIYKWEEGEAQKVFSSVLGPGNYRIEILPQSKWISFFNSYNPGQTILLDSDLNFQDGLAQVPWSWAIASQANRFVDLEGDLLNQSLVVREASTFKKISSKTRGLSASKVDITSDGKWIVIINNYRFEVWKVDGLEQVADFILRKHADHLAFSKDGKKLLLASESGSILVDFELLLQQLLENPRGSVLSDFELLFQ